MRRATSSKAITNQASQVADAQSVNLVNDILSDAAARAPLMGASQNLTVFPGYDVALKTGTSNNYVDAWSMGYTPSLVVGVWAGNNDDSPMQKNGSSILAAVPMWSAFMQQALPEVPNETFAQPDPVNETKPILAGVPYPDGAPHSDLFYISKDDPGEDHRPTRQPTRNITIGRRPCRHGPRRTRRASLRLKQRCRRALHQLRPKDRFDDIKI